MFVWRTIGTNLFVPKSRTSSPVTTICFVTDTALPVVSLTVVRLRTNHQDSFGFRDGLLHEFRHNVAWAKSHWSNNTSTPLSTSRWANDATHALCSFESCEYEIKTNGLSALGESGIAILVA
jgi:hypothetical protein